MSIGPSIPEIQNFQNLTLKIQGEDEMTMMLHNYRSRQFHITSNGINPSSGFRDMASTNSGPSVGSFDKIWLGKPIWGNGQITTTVHNYKSRQVHKTLSGLNPSSGFRDLRSASLAQFVPNLTSFWSMGKPIRGKWPWQCTTTVCEWVSEWMNLTAFLGTADRSRQFHRTSNGENSSSSYRDMGSASLAPTWTKTTIPLQPRGLRCKQNTILIQIGRFHTVTPEHKAWSSIDRRGALLFFKVIHQVSRWRGTKNCQFWTELGVYRW